MNEQEVVMVDKKVHVYIEGDREREEGHVDTRESNHECETADSIGCDHGIDVAG